MTETTARASGRNWRRFALHYLEMIVAMFAGMFLLGGLQSLAGLGFSYGTDPEAAYLLMAVNMSIGMAAWMLFRGHGRGSTLEMCAAMFAPAVPLFPLLWLGLLDGHGMMVAAHVAMFPAMLAVMLRRLDEFAGCAR